MNSRRQNGLKFVRYVTIIDISATTCNPETLNKWNIDLQTSETGHGGVNWYGTLTIGGKMRQRYSERIRLVSLSTL